MIAPTVGKKTMQRGWPPRTNGSWSSHGVMARAPSWLMTRLIIIVMYNTSFSRYRYAVEAKKVTFRIALLEIKISRYITFALNVLRSSFHSCNSRSKASTYLSLSLRRYPVLVRVFLFFFFFFLSFFLLSCRFFKALTRIILIRCQYVNLIIIRTTVLFYAVLNNAG